MLLAPYGFCYPYGANVARCGQAALSAVALLQSTWKQNEQRNETIFVLFLFLSWKKYIEQASQWNVLTSLMLMQLASTRACWIPSNDRASWIPSKGDIHAINSRINQQFSADWAAVCTGTYVMLSVHQSVTVTKTYSATTALMSYLF